MANNCDNVDSIKKKQQLPGAKTALLLVIITARLQDRHDHLTQGIPKLGVTGACDLPKKIWRFIAERIL